MSPRTTAKQPANRDAAMSLYFVGWMYVNANIGAINRTTDKRQTKTRAIRSLATVERENRLERNVLESNGIQGCQIDIIGGVNCILGGLWTDDFRNRTTNPSGRTVQT